MIKEKLCVFCTHWQFSGGDQGYSDLTPGTDASMNCDKRRYGSFRLFDLYDESAFRRQILFATTCPDYDEVKT